MHSFSYYLLYSRTSFVQNRVHPILKKCDRLCGDTGLRFSLGVWKQGPATETPDCVLTSHGNLYFWVEGRPRIGGLSSRGGYSPLAGETALT